MLPTERGEFARIIAGHLGAYAKIPTAEEITLWFEQLKNFSVDDIGRALDAHQHADEDGKRAPRPIDVIRRLRAGASGGDSCSVTWANGRCQFPGVFSESTNGGGPWFCSWHITDRSGPNSEAYIRASQDTPHSEALAKRVNRMNAEAADSPAVRAIRAKMAARVRPAGNLGEFLPRHPGEDEEAA